MTDATTTSTITPIRTINLNDHALYQQLVELARRNDRSIAAEARVAIRSHLKAEATHEDTP